MASGTGWGCACSHGLSHGRARRLLCCACCSSPGSTAAPRSGQVLDEARAAGRDAASFPAADEDYFHDMDGGVTLTPEEIKGRNMWLVWTGGNDRFWDGMTDHTFGAFDLLKIVALRTRPARLHRDPRWSYFGLVNEPCFEDADAGPTRTASASGSTCAPPTARPIRSRTRRSTPGVTIGARGKTLSRSAPSTATPSGIVGLRLFPNPDFDEAAAQALGRRALLHRPELLQRQGPGAPVPRRHVLRLLPCRPEPGQSAGRSGASAVGESQLHRRRAVHVGRPAVHLHERRDPTNYMYQLVHTYRPGAMDTSLVSTDYINNPRTMNAVYNLGARLEHRASAGAGEAGRRRARQQAVQRLRHQRTADAVLREAEHGVDAARAEGRRRLGRRRSAR